METLGGGMYIVEVGHGGVLGYTILWDIVSIDASGLSASSQP